MPRHAPACYQREITVPSRWSGRRITLETLYTISYAVVYLDGKKIGEIRYPAGEVDRTGAALRTPLPARFANPVRQSEIRWLDGLYFDVPGEWDDPYRFFHW